MNATRDFNLSTDALHANQNDIPGSSLSVWDGQQLVVQQTSRSGWWEIFKLLWKYGMAPIKTINLMKSTVGKFMDMYEEPVFPWSSLTQTVHDLDLLAATAATGEQYMREHGITGDFGHDIVQASTRVNYAQNLRYIHGLEAMVCMAADGAVAIEGGNWQIFDQMVAAANATRMLGTEVTSVKRQENSFVLDYCDATDESTLSTQAQHFDSVILAGPYQFTNLTRTSPQDYTPDEIPYVELHVTLFTSPQLLSPTFFNLAPNQPAPKVILTTLPPNEEPGHGPQSCGSPGFFSISLLRRITNPQTQQREYLYKIFSPSPPTPTFLSHLLGLQIPKDIPIRAGLGEKDITWIYRKLWHSYPYEDPRVTFDRMELEEGLWYTGGMDAFISTMETNALMGRNVAKLMVERWVERGAEEGFSRLGFEDEEGLMGGRGV